MVSFQGRKSLKKVAEIKSSRPLGAPRGLLYLTSRSQDESAGSGEAPVTGPGHCWFGQNVKRALIHSISDRIKAWMGS